MSILHVSFVNNSQLPSTIPVSVAFLPGPPPPGKPATPCTVTNSKDGSPILPLDDAAGAYPHSGNWYPLSALPGGVDIQSFSGRIYIAYGTPWSIVGAGYEPAQAVTDPNFFLCYDKMEITFTGLADDVADLTSIDYWAIPMTLNVLKSGTVIQTAHGLKNGATTQTLYDALSALTTPPQSGLAGPGGNDGIPLSAVVPGSFVQYSPQSPSPGANFARIIGPSSYPSIYSSDGELQPGIPVQPYDLLRSYLQYLLTLYGPGTVTTITPPLGNGVIANIAGEFGGVGNPPPATGPESRQAYALTATIDSGLNITLTGTVGSAPGTTTMVFKCGDLLNPTGIYGGNCPYHLNGSSTPTPPGNDVYGWIGGDLAAGFNIGAVGSRVTVGGPIPGIDTPAQVGALKSQQWFLLSPFLFSLLQSRPFYNQWAATLAQYSDAYNFAYSDRFAAVQVTLDPARVDTIQIVLEQAVVT